MAKTVRYGKKLFSLILTLAMLLGMLPAFQIVAEAKTDSAASCENFFFYAKDKNGDSVLLGVYPIDTLKELAHGYQSGVYEGQNYYFSYTDNLPTYGYAEGKGITLPELIGYVKTHSTVTGANSITYSGDDVLGFMASDAATYSQAWKASDAFQTRYYYPGIYDAADGWTTDWETNGGNPDANYTDDSAAANPVYFTDAKNAASETGVWRDHCLLQHR